MTTFKKMFLLSGMSPFLTDFVRHSLIRYLSPTGDGVAKFLPGGYPKSFSGTGPRWVEVWQVEDWQLGVAVLKPRTQIDYRFLSEGDVVVLVSDGIRTARQVRMTQTGLPLVNVPSLEPVDSETCGDYQKRWNQRIDFYMKPFLGRE